MKTESIKFINPTPLGILGSELAILEFGNDHEAIAEKRQELHNRINDRLEEDYNLRPVYHDGEVVGISQLMVATIDEQECSDTDGTHVEYAFARVEPIRPLRMDLLTTAVGKTYSNSTEGSCGCIHDCCGCVRWHSTAAHVASNGDKYHVFSMRMYATSNI